MSKVATIVSNILACLCRGKQAVLDNFGVTKYVCGYVLGSVGVMPGETQYITLTVDEKICEGGGLISMVSMLGKKTILLQDSNSLELTTFLLDGMDV